MSSQLPFKLKDMKFWNKKTLTITDYDPVFKVIYLGNVLTTWAKGDEHVEKPLGVLWKNYLANVKQETIMKLTICNSGLKAITREHGLTEYWSNRITFTGTSSNHSKVFFWIYRHEGRKMKQELRCHAVMCGKEKQAKEMQQVLNERLITALREFRREKTIRQNVRLSIIATSSVNGINSDFVQHHVPQIPLRKKLLIKGLANFRQPLERSKSAPKLTSIEETLDEEEDEEYEIEDEEYTNFCGSISSDGRESSSDIIPDDLDSISEQLSSISVNIISNDNNNSLQTTTSNTNNNNNNNDNICSQNTDNIIWDNLAKNKLLINEKDREKHKQEVNDVNDEDSISNESGYSETADTPLTTKIESS